MLLLSFLPLGCLGSKQERAIAKVGKHMQRIHDAQYTYSLQKASSTETAARMHKEVEGIPSSTMPSLIRLRSKSHYVFSWSNGRALNGSRHRYSMAGRTS
ncbi:MAG: hypothetical protein JNL52_11725 [Flavobacteriales bacterium]|nr:hypothetical protein [Flavobacteriales bacterium]